MTMTRRAMLAAVLCAAAGTARAQASAVGAALLQFEEAVTWEAVGAEWRDIRPGWVQRVGAAKSPRELAALLAQLETSMGWHAVEEARWRARRDSWLAEAQRAGSDAQVARLLLELEEVTLWSAVDQSWRNTRPGWVARMQQAAAGR